MKVRRQYRLYLFIIWVIFFHMSAAQIDYLSAYRNYWQATHPDLSKKLARDSIRFCFDDYHGRFVPPYFLEPDCSQPLERMPRFRPPVLPDFYLNHHSPGYPSMLPKTTGVRQAWVRHYAPRNTPSFDSACEVAVDQQNNIYVTGYTTRMPNGLDIYTIKYDPQGNEIWSAYYDSGINSDDWDPQIELDGEGNVYIKGNIRNRWEEYKVILVKYDHQGNQEWVIQEGMGKNARSNMIVTDKDRIYLLMTWNLDCQGVLIEEIDSNGELVWQACLDDVWLYPLILCQNYQGNIYVAGTRNQDLIAFKYGGDGQLLWQQSFSPSEENYAGSYSLEVDKTGNVYILGEISYDDPCISLLKYDPEGNLLWDEVYSERTASYLNSMDMMLDDSGNVYISFLSAWEDGFGLVKYTPEGIVKWTRQYYTGGYHYYDEFLLAIDSQDNPIISGACDSNEPGNKTQYYFTVKYSPAGELLWSVFESCGKSPRALTLDSDNHVIICGDGSQPGTGTDYLTIKYTPDGQKQWARFYNGANRDNECACDLITDYEGNIYTAGLDRAGAVLVKYGSDGQRLWTHRESESGMYHLDMDSRGNVFGVSSYDHNIHTYKFKPDGNRAWKQIYDGPESEMMETLDHARGITVDPQGNTFIHGTSYYHLSTDLITISYNPAGQLRWINRYPNSKGEDIALSQNGNVFVGGYCSDTSYTGNAYLALKYNHKGDLIWEKMYREGLTGEIKAVAVDGWSNVYVTGYFAYPLPDNDYKNNMVTLKYSADGELQWIDHYGPENISTGWEDYYIAVDAFDNVYVSTQYTDITQSPRQWRHLIIKYDAQGNQQWIVKEDGKYLKDMVLDREGNVYLTGGTSHNQVYTNKHNPRGEKCWQMLYDSQGTAEDECWAITVDRQGNVYLPVTTGGCYWSQFKILKYVQTDQDTLTLRLVEDHILAHNQPNPFNSKTLIRYNLSCDQKVTFNVYNNLGQLITTQPLGRRPAGRNFFYFIAPRQLPSGVYYYQLETPKTTRAGKMTLLR